MMFANPPRLHLNEHFSHRMAVQLRKRGFDVTSSQECGMLTEPDDVQLAHATANGRAILSFNIKDFVRLHKQYMTEGREHWGIILSTELPIKILIHRLLRLFHSVSADELKNQLRWLNEFK